MLRTPPFLLSLALTLATSCGFLGEPSLATPDAEQAPTVHIRSVISAPYHIDDRYMSMRGPFGVDDVTLGDPEQPELLWIVGYRTTVVDEAGEQELSQEWMCHANLDFEPRDYYSLFSTRVPVSGRLFTLSQGQQEILFPEGFGIPVSSNLPIRLATQVLNLNVEDPDVTVRHKVDVLYLKDSEAPDSMTALFQSAVEGFKALGEARHYGFSPTEVDTDLHGPGCSVGQAAIAGDVDPDRLGQAFTAHWVVEPGREVNRTNVTRFLNLPFDTRAHYIAAHLHPFAQSLELRDLTTNSTVFMAHAKNSEGRVGLDEVTYLSSEEGLLLRAGHEYELVSVYDNTSGQPVDSMAVMYMYLADPTFQKPTLEELELFTPESRGESRVGM